MTKLLTQQDLAERWQVDIATIRNWRLEGIIQPVKNIPSIRFNEQYINELEGVKLERISPLQVRRLENELEKVTQENIRMKSIISKIVAEGSQIYMEV